MRLPVSNRAKTRSSLQITGVKASLANHFAGGSGFKQGVSEYGPFRFFGGRVVVQDFDGCGGASG